MCQLSLGVECLTSPKFPSRYTTPVVSRTVTHSEDVTSKAGREVGPLSYSGNSSTGDCV